MLKSSKQGVNYPERLDFKMGLKFPNQETLASEENFMTTEQTQLSSTVYEHLISQSYEGHQLTRIELSYAKSCVYCRKIGRRVPCGRFVQTHYKCTVCDVPLCISKSRNCFIQYHEWLKTTGMEGAKFYT